MREAMWVAMRGWMQRGVLPSRARKRVDEKQVPNLGCKLELLLGVELGMR